MYIMYFNSIKVQLEHQYLYRCREKPSGFQFHKGTIRTQASRLDNGRILRFQFHKGTIRTRFNAEEAAKNRDISIP